MPTASQLTVNCIYGGVAELLLRTLFGFVGVVLEAGAQKVPRYHSRLFPTIFFRKANHERLSLFISLDLRVTLPFLLVKIFRYHPPFLLFSIYPSFLLHGPNQFSWFGRVKENSTRQLSLQNVISMRSAPILFGVQEDNCSKSWVHSERHDSNQDTRPTPLFPLCLSLSPLHGKGEGLGDYPFVLPSAQGYSTTIRIGFREKIHLFRRVMYFS